MATRHEVNAACIAAAKLLISGSAVGFSGQLLVLEPPYAHGCYACLYPEQEEPQRNCRTAGVLGPVVGVIGTPSAGGHQDAGRHAFLPQRETAVVRR